MSSPIDPISGLPLDLLNSPTINQIQLGARTDFIDDFNPQGQPPPTLYPDQAPNILATIGAKNPKNPRVAQALQTDGEGRLQVTTGSGLGGDGTASGLMQPNCVISESLGLSSQPFSEITLDNPADILCELTWSFALNGPASPNPGPSSEFSVSVGGPGRVAPLIRNALPISLNVGDRFSVQSGSLVWSGGMDIRNLRNASDRSTLVIVCHLTPVIFSFTFLYWSASGGTS